MAKVTKASVNYREGKPARRCGICTMFRAPSGCTAVEGEIAAKDVCDLFERKRGVLYTHPRSPRKE